MYIYICFSNRKGEGIWYISKSSTLYVSALSSDLSNDDNQEIKCENEQ